MGGGEIDTAQSTRLALRESLIPSPLLIPSEPRRVDGKAGVSLYILKIDFAH